MTLLVQPRLVNEPFSDPVLLLDFRFGGKAVLFDLGDLSALSPREILRVSHIFVSHMHMDHFSGFDRLLGVSLYREKQVHIIGPPGLADAVQAKLRAYTWNLLNERSQDFTIFASDWTEEGFATAAVFRARRAFVRENWQNADTQFPLDDPEFTIEAVTLDHGIPCLAFAFQEKLRVDVHRSRLDELDLTVGPWLTNAKRAARRGADAATEFTPDVGRKVTLGELLRAKALVCAPGQRIAYATDLAFCSDNVTRLSNLVRGADELFIEGGFLEADRDLAASKKHLTAAQAGAIARQAGAISAHQIHLSPRYLGREDELRAEFEAGFLGGSVTAR
ncbi:MBL fold metallo-hydrolase [Mesorhizobium sp. WSM4906]|uniref:MBL fold metallo-hydrolase n=1 Tax=Mesorhizobium sp. WSM4906 TaxID=3038546 RepID=UPI0024176C45|nr:MBL fold metallo-hydrolase [Mesorhizobium sp. WSM4906]WFP76132.1 MBL fold metallo-hydrolase [Mesorhizobium sp. WSM4906]